jgi:ATP sulfurylase
VRWREVKETQSCPSQENIVKKKNWMVDCWWPMPVILTMQETKIRRIKVRGQWLGNSLRDPILKILNIKKALTQSRNQTST